LLPITEGFRETLEQPGTQLSDVVLIAQAADHHDELVAADARNQIVGANALPESFGHAHQYLVASGVAHRIVHGLEAIEIDVQQRELRIGAVQRVQLGREVFLQAAAVGQAGQWVMLGKIVDVSLHAGLFGDIGGGAPETEVRAVEQDRTCRQAIMPLAAISGVVAAAQGRIRRGQPVSQCRFVGIQQFGHRPAQPVAPGVPGDFFEAAGKVRQASVPVDFPEPVGGRLGYVPKALFAGGQRGAAG